MTKKSKVKMITISDMKFFKKPVMTEEQRAIEKAWRDLEEWILSLQKQSKTGTLGDKESKLLLEIRDMAKGIKKSVPAPDPKINPIPKSPPVDYMEMGAKDLFAKLDSKRDLMTPEQRYDYNKLRRLFEEDRLSLPWGAENDLRRMYGTYFYSRPVAKIAKSVENSMDPISVMSKEERDAYVKKYR
jgi:hypothetical protein